MPVRERESYHTTLRLQSGARMERPATVFIWLAEGFRWTKAECTQQEGALTTTYSFLADARRFCAKINWYLELFMIHSTFTKAPFPAEEKQPQSIMLPPPCFTVGSGSGLPPTPLDRLTSPRDRKPPPMDGVTPPSICPSIPSDVTVMAESEPCIEDVQAPLYWALQACRHTVKKQICDDVERRLMLFENMWKSGKLSPLVKRRMHRLSQAGRSTSSFLCPNMVKIKRKLWLHAYLSAQGPVTPAIQLKSKNWDTADEIHRGLMVDHITEVSQWMVGVKRLIAEARNLNPELLQTGDLGQNEINNCPEPES
ncbi:steroid receptor RNA activator 1 isoform X3 [Myxocyprinus asiaticus]|uniref:steroid receptor RNA activator 1 isoform X3 n=1 Tax=Myxocyprinus asiaticus TaxID=70543 RepID=UPI0022223F8D|nr:steroid receptor RNA activator 1 isoform X3 [Myxocyprinus asiaticus]